MPCRCPYWTIATTPFAEILHKFVFLFASCNIANFVNHRFDFTECITQNICKFLNYFAELHPVPLDYANSVFYQPFETYNTDSMAFDFLRLFFRKCYIHFILSNSSENFWINSSSSQFGLTVTKLPRSEMTPMRLHPSTVCRPSSTAACPLWCAARGSRS